MKNSLSNAAPAFPVADALDDQFCLSIVMRFHRGGDIRFLDEALFALALQDLDNIELVIMVQNGCPALESEIEDLCRGQPWRVMPQRKIISVPAPAGADLRANLLNRGISASTGRYLAFLDYDDLVYHHGYVTLIQRLQSTSHAIAVGGCRIARMVPFPDHWYVRAKNADFVGPTTVFEFFRSNNTPIHAFVIDRARLDDFELRVDESLSRSEDYDLLLRMFACHEPDFGLREVPTCEYRIRLDGSNTILDGNPAPSQEARSQWSLAEKFIDWRKQQLRVSVRVSDIAAVLDERQALIAQYEQELASVRVSLAFRFSRILDAAVPRSARVRGGIRRVLRLTWRLTAPVRRSVSMLAGGR